LQRTEIFTVCGACPWSDAEEFSLSWDQKFFLEAIAQNKKITLGRGQKNLFLPAAHSKFYCGCGLPLG
jgi:hypothetical protein